MARALTALPQLRSALPSSRLCPFCRFPNFYGNYFIRGTDLMSLPNCSADSTFTMDLAYDEQQLSAQAITVQAALLYTNSNGERRIRVHTMVLPVTQVQRGLDS
jgi:protein transport protein SEC24